jgi:hypothetical protein
MTSSSIPHPEEDLAKADDVPQKMRMMQSLPMKAPQAPRSRFVYKGSVDKCGDSSGGSDSERVGLQTYTIGRRVGTCESFRRRGADAEERRRPYK